VTGCGIQVGDTGALVLEGPAGRMVFEVMDVQSFAGYVMHVGKLVSGPAGGLRGGDALKCEVDYRRRGRVAPNHTMTHVLNFALRKVLGANVDQRGSLVNDEKLRFDFSHGSAMTVEEIREVEAITQQAIDQRLPISSKVGRRP
jgi:alanyl-tRNA synthetase